MPPQRSGDRRRSLPKASPYTRRGTKTEQEIFEDYARMGELHGMEISNTIPRTPHMRRSSAASGSRDKSQGRNWRYEVQRKKTLEEEFGDLSRVGDNALRRTRSGLTIEPTARLETQQVRRSPEPYETSTSGPQGMTSGEIANTRSRSSSLGDTVIVDDGAYLEQQMPSEPSAANNWDAAFLERQIPLEPEQQLPFEPKPDMPDEPSDAGNWEARPFEQHMPFEPIDPGTWDPAFDEFFEVQTAGPVIAREPPQQISVQHQDWCEKFANKQVKLCIVDANNANVYTNLHRSRDLPVAFFGRDNNGKDDPNFYSSVTMLDAVSEQQHRASPTSIAFEFYHALWYDTETHKNEYEAWLKQLSELCDLSQVRQVEFKRAEWGEDVGDENTQAKTYELLFKLLAHFPGMTVLTMSDYDPSMVQNIASDELSVSDMMEKCDRISNTGLNDKDVFHLCQKELAALLVKHRNLFAGGVVPRLEVIDNYAALGALQQHAENASST